MLYHQIACFIIPAYINTSSVAENIPEVADFPPVRIDSG